MFAEHLSRCELRKAMEIDGLFGKCHLRNLYERLDDSLRCWALVDDDNTYEVLNLWSNWRNLREIACKHDV